MPFFRHDCPLAVKPASTPWCLVHKTTWRNSLPIDMLLSVVSVLVVVQPSSEVPEGLMNYPLHSNCHHMKLHDVHTSSMLQHDSACGKLYRMHWNSVSFFTTSTSLTVTIFLSEANNFIFWIRTAASQLWCHGHLTIRDEKLKQNETLIFNTWAIMSYFYIVYSMHYNAVKNSGNNNKCTIL